MAPRTRTTGNRPQPKQKQPKYKKAGLVLTANRAGETSLVGKEKHQTMCRQKREMERKHGTHIISPLNGRRTAINAGMYFCVLRVPGRVGRGTSSGALDGGLYLRAFSLIPRPPDLGHCLPTSLLGHYFCNVLQMEIFKCAIHVKESFINGVNMARLVLNCVSCVSYAV